VVTFYVTFTPRLSTGLYVLGAALTTALLALVGALLGWVTRFNPNYGYAFGSLQTIFLVFVWVYYCFAAILLVAEILANLRNREMLALRGLFDPGRADARSRYFLHGILKKYPAGACIFTEGDSRHEMFYVVDGRVSLGASDQKARTVKAGDFFGEMAVLTRGRRTTTATAGDDGVTVAVITADHFETVLRENPRILKNLLNRMHDCAREIGDTVRI
jgi:membrane protein